MKSPMLICACLLMAGCVSGAEQMQNEQIERVVMQYNHDAQCRKAGFSSNTAKFRECLSRLEDEELADR